MDLSTLQRLALLNREFYAAHAENFADSRPRLAPGAQRVLDLIRAQIAPVQAAEEQAESSHAMGQPATPEQATGQPHTNSPTAQPIRVLELGCGDGKVARALPAAAYIGVDQSSQMIQRAEHMMRAAGRKSQAAEQAAQRPLPSDAAHGSYSFHAADLTDPDWPAGLPPGLYDWVLAFGLFHHLPGRALRQRVLRQAAGLLRPGGRAAMSNWQFARSERLLARVRPWPLAGFDPADLEAGDYLLAWERKGRSGLRYVHLLGQVEARELAAGAGLRILDVFQSDGVSGGLSEYVVMRNVD